MVKCGCDECAKDPKAGWFKAHRSRKSPYNWIRFLPGHGNKRSSAKLRISKQMKIEHQSPARKAADKITGCKLGVVYGKKNFSKWRNSIEGKEQAVELGNEYYEYRLRTDHEKIVFKLLKQLKLKVIWNRKTVPIGNNKGGYYRIDLYLIDKKIAIELDGGKHDRKKQKKRDAKRDIVLLGYGIRTIRMKNEEVNSLTKKKLLKLIKAVEEGGSE